VEEAHGIGERVLDEHALGVAGDEFFGGGFCVVGEQDGGLVVTEIGDKELAVSALARTSLLFEDPRGAVFAVGQVERDGAPSRWRQVADFGEQTWRAPA
jgi:hypothetical protein